MIMHILGIIGKISQSLISNFIKMASHGKYSGRNKTFLVSKPKIHKGYGSQKEDPGIVEKEPIINILCGLNMRFFSIQSIVLVEPQAGMVQIRFRNSIKPLK
ncbi:MAG: hypothetical protein GY874_08940 [Desulfobacteraceae bacterium]|nr:hypothetical protein [Desulfobacteraceae bacterium]